MSFIVSKLLKDCSTKNRRSFVRVSDRPSRTNVDYANDADINVIVARFLKTGLMPTASTAPMVFGDVSLVPKGTDALMAVRAAHARFERFPSELRKSIGSFDKFESWIRDPANRDLAIKFGLVKPSGEVSKPSAGKPAEGSPVAKDNASKEAPSPEKGASGGGQT